MTRPEEFEQLRPLLFAITYRIFGSVTEAEDAVQETWLRYQASPAPPVSAKAFLSAVVTRISIDVLRSAGVRREEYAGPWLPEPLLTDPYQDPARSAELADSVSMAATRGRRHYDLSGVSNAVRQDHVRLTQILGAQQRAAEEDTPIPWNDLQAMQREFGMDDMKPYEHEYVFEPPPGCPRPR